MGFKEPFFNQTADGLIDHLLSIPSAMRERIDQEAFSIGKAVEIPLPADARTRFKTPSGKIEILNPREPHPLPCHFPAYGGDYPFRLMTSPSFYALNSSFREREDLRKKEEAMLLQMNPADTEGKGLKEGDPVLAFNQLGEVSFTLHVTPKVPSGVVVAEGVWWLKHCHGPRSVNALTSQRLTDQGGGSTFYDNTVDVRPEGNYAPQDWTKYTKRSGYDMTRDYSDYINDIANSIDEIEEFIEGIDFDTFSDDKKTK
jgi:anaerobic selenocysteine-containing dehydrogenase